MRVPTDAGDGEPPFRHPDDLVLAIRSYQTLLAVPEEEQSPEVRVRLRAERQACLEVIAAATEEPLRREAWRWCKSQAFREVLESLSREEGIDAAIRRFALQLFLHVVVELPRLKVDDDKAVVGLLVVVARRGMSREERRVYGLGVHRTQEGAIVPIVRLSEAHVDGTDADLPDAASEAALEQLLDRIAQAGLLQRITTFLADPALSNADRHILQGRLLHEPPRPYADLVGELGPGWTVEAARQRFTRLSRRLRTRIDADER